MRRRPQHVARQSEIVEIIRVVTVCPCKLTGQSDRDGPPWAVEAGGKVVRPFTSIAPNGTIALVEDADGNVIGLHEEAA